MKVRTIVNLCTYGDTLESVRVVNTGRISRVGVDNGFNTGSCYAVDCLELDYEALFYMKPELGTRRYLSAQNAAFWIEEGYKLNIKFVSLEPAFDGVRGWISISELDAIDPNIPGSECRFLTKKKDWTAHDGTIFVYAFPVEESDLPENV